MSCASPTRGSGTDCAARSRGSIGALRRLPSAPIWGKIPTGAEGNRRNAPIDPRERAAGMVPLTRVGEAQDIANGVLFLCTEAANYMTGQELVIDGGITAGGRPQPRPQ